MTSVDPNGNSSGGLDPQIAAMLRNLLMMAGSALVAKGYLDSGLLQQGVGVVLTALGFGYSIYTHRKIGLLKQVAKLPEVKQVVLTDQKLADSVPRAEVVGPAGT